MTPSDKVYFLHIRPHSQQGDIMGKGGMTIAYRVEDDNTGVFRIALGKAICHPNDNFCRQAGRIIATKRLDTQHPICNYLGHDLCGEVQTRHTLRKDIHKVLTNWAYGV